MKQMPPIELQEYYILSLGFSGPSENGLMSLLWVKV